MIQKRVRENPIKRLCKFQIETLIQDFIARAIKVICKSRGRLAFIPKTKYNPRRLFQISSW